MVIMPSAKIFLLLASLLLALAVALGAFGAHALKNRLPPDLLAVYHTAVQYHFYHALGLLLIGVLALQFPPSMWLRVAGGLMLAGVVLFSGSLYLLSFTGVRWLGAVTPLGGIAFIGAWLALAVAVVRTTTE